MFDCIILKCILMVALFISEVELNIQNCTIPEVVNVHTIGDSHTRWRSSILDHVKFRCNIISHSMPGKTMHGAVNQGIRIINFQQYSVQENEIVMFNFGEIDSRNHLHRFKDVGLYKEIIRLVTEYENLILANKNLVPSAKIWIGGLVPTKFNPNSEHIGTNHERFLYNRLLNDEIMRMARRNNFFYLDNYADYADDDGFLSYPLSDNHIHIGPEKYTLKTKIAIAKEIDRIFGACSKHYN